MKLVFELSMPGRSSWNGRWSGENNLYAVVENFTTNKRKSKASQILESQPYFYRWDDGWAARINVRAVESKESASIKRRSKGFCGYEWMIRSILDHGAIYASRDEIPKLSSCNEPQPE